MKIEVLADAKAVAQRAATVIATDARAAVAARGRFAMAVSGGRTPWAMLRALADEEFIAWSESAGLPIAPLSAQDATVNFADQHAFYEKYKDVL